MRQDQVLQHGVSVIIPSWNGRQLLEKYLPAVVNAATAYEALSHQNTEIIVVDDASSDGTCAWLKMHYAAVRAESNERRLGFAPTVNRGVRMARHPLVYILNNDVAIEPGTLPPLADHFAHNGVFAVAGQVYDYDTGILRGAGQVGEFRRGFLGVHQRYFAADSRQAPGEPWLTLFATGGSSMFDREKFLTIGGFDEMFAPFGWEDVELSLRAWKQGFEVHYEPQSRVWHQFSSTIAPRFPRREVRAIYERNRLLTHWLHLDSSSDLAANAFFLASKLPASVFAGRWETWSATAQALRLVKGVRAKRRELRRKQRRRLGDVLCQVAGQMSRPGAVILNERSAPRTVTSGK
ncbi:MAG: glycosyltransferase family 2 protein [Terriglobia bacterium]